MGKLMALSLMGTLTAAVLFQPILMGPPRKTNTHKLRQTIATRPN
jgi:hypothetical protein